MTRKALVVSLVAAATVALLLAAVGLRQWSASAQPIGGATYTGRLSPGGCISFRVSADGTEVTNLGYALTTDGCVGVAAYADGGDLPIENDEFEYETANVEVIGSFLSDGTAEGTIETAGKPPCDDATWTATTGATPEPSPTPTPTAVPEEGKLENCPQPGKWAIAVWNGDDSTDAEQAFATCSDGVVISAYDLDAETQTWKRYFAGQPGMTTLSILNNMQGVIALGGEAP